jgi:predicted transcriptional regulator
MRNETGSGKTISRRRRLVGLTQHALAKKSRVPVQKITFAETGRAELTPEELNRIWSALRVRAQKVFDAVANG